MATDPRSFVRPGERLRIAATQINALNALIRRNGGFETGELPGNGPLTTIILARNSTGGDLARWGVMSISGIEIDPNDGDNERRSFEEMPCVIGETLAADAGVFVVAVEPIKSGKIGRVAAAGIVQVTAETLGQIRDYVTVIWEDGEWALIRISGGGGGGIRFGKVSGSWPKGTTHSVTRLKGNGDPPTTPSTFTAKNWFCDISIDCGERYVACAKVDSTWILIAAECEGASGGS